MSKINPRRLTILVTLLLFALLSAWTGSWRRATEFDSQVRHFQSRIVAEEYALEHGTTIEEINRQFLDNEQKRFDREKESGLPECRFLLTRGKPCARPPIITGGPIIDFPKGTISELFEVSKRALPSLASLLSDFLKAASAGVLICLVFPMLIKKVWRWLQGGGRSVT
jgi:hypothetical protein